MARTVDLTQRRRDLADAALRMLTERGPSALTLRGLAKEMGGSITLITHYFSDRTQMMDAILEVVLADYDREVQAIDSQLPPEERLRALLLWIIPRSEEDIRLERGRMLLVADRETDEAARRFLDAHEVKMRDLLRQHLVGQAREPRLSVLVEALRVLSSGVTLSTVEHPDLWTLEHQEQMVDFMLESLGLHTPSKKRRAKPAPRARTATRK